jgi:5'-nucleotidase
MTLSLGICIGRSIFWRPINAVRAKMVAASRRALQGTAMRILLTNDDGIRAPGLEVLERIARTFSDEIWLVAPAEEQSGAGHSLTLTVPVRLRKLGERRFAVTGTPTDAVMMGLANIMKDSRPDLILSGVNRGANLGEDVTYSGTVSAAMEGALAGIPSIALSQCYPREGMGDTVPFAAAEAWADKVLRPLIETPMASRTLVNVNFPALPPGEVKGVRVVRQGLRDYGRLRIDRRTDPRGYAYYWFGLGPMIQTPGHDTDLEAIDDGYVAVTPLHLDLTHEESLARLGALYR